MSTSDAVPQRPRSIPQPPTTAEDLRAALAVLAPEQLTTFDAERAAALHSARHDVSAAPMRRFVNQWAVIVAVERDAERASRYHELEARASTVNDLTEARAIASELGDILDVACAEAGIPRNVAA